MRLSAVVALLVVVAACESSPVGPVGPTTSGSTTTTTIDNDTCERVADATVGYLEDLIEGLDATRLSEFTDLEEWPQELRDLRRAGKDLDLRVNALRCDPVAIQQRAFAEANLDPQGPLSEELLELLLAPDPLGAIPTTVPATTTDG